MRRLSWWRVAVGVPVALGIVACLVLVSLQRTDYEEENR